MAQKEKSKVWEDFFQPPVGDQAPKEVGVKFDQDKKIRPSLIPVEWMEELSFVLAKGAKKYGDRNWENGMKWSRLEDAAMRHLLEWKKGNVRDEETGAHHLAQAAWNLLALMVYQQRSIGDCDIPVYEVNKREEMLIERSSQ